MLSGLLDGPRASEPFLLKVLLDPPWSMRIEDNAPLTLMALAAGSAWINPDHGEPVALAAGDTALVRGLDHYVVTDDPATPPSVIIGTGQVCTTPEGHDLADEMGLGVRTWGNTGGSTNAGDDPEAVGCRMLVGVYESQPEVGARFLAALPPVSVVKADEHRSPLLEMLGDELVKDGAGQQVILNRLLDLLVITTARVVFDRDDSTPGWFLAQADPVIGPVLNEIYRNPGRPWSVAEMANRGGLSRAAFAHRFKELVGESPIAFLTDWRISMAADRLRSSDDTVVAVAADVGYATPYAFSTAFKRVKGVSPTAYRRLSAKSTV